MCANYAPSAREQLLHFGRPEPDFAYGEAYPAHLAPVLTNFDPRRWLPACFGLVPGWAKDIKIARSTYNARAETVAEKPSFRHAWRQRQFCVIPAEAIFEPCYESGKAQRWRIARADAAPFGIAGIWERRVPADGLPEWSMSMLTINADGHPLMQRFHKPGDEKRSVVILPDEAWDAWLGARREEDARALLRLFAPEEMIATPAAR
jgi:putative SOS response-associated peptidase YedK